MNEKRVEDRDLQAVRRSVRVDEEDSVSAVRFEKMARNRFCCLACKPRCRWAESATSTIRTIDGKARRVQRAIGQIPQPILITGICVLICLVLLFIVLFAWLRARGRFILVDCVVRDRAAIGEPWEAFRGEGNSFFLFSLLVVLVIVPVIVIAGLVLIVPFIPGHEQTEPGVGFWIGISLTAFISVCLIFVWGLASQLMVPIINRQRCRARVAFARAVGLVSSHPGRSFFTCYFLCCWRSRWL